MIVPLLFVMPAAVMPAAVPIPGINDVLEVRRCPDLDWELPIAEPTMRGRVAIRIIIIEA